MTTKKIRINGRKAAEAILLELARHKEGRFSFCCSFSYDDDSDFLNRVAERLGVVSMACKPFLSRIQRVCRRLEQCGVLGGQLLSCHAEYLGEPRVLKRYEFADHGYAMRLAPDLYPNYKPSGTPEGELQYLLRHAYPSKDES